MRINGKRIKKKGEKIGRTKTDEEECIRVLKK